MIKIPGADKRISIPNTSDLFGNIHYVNNMNFDEEGYIKLAPRSVLLKSEKEESNLGMPISFGRHNPGSYLVVTSDQAYKASIGETSIAVNEDTSTDNPTLSLNSWGRWWQNRWHATTQTEMWYRTPTSSSWTNTGISLSSGKSHPIEVFRNRNTVCVGNGNRVEQYDVDYVDGGGLINSLVLPSDYEVIGLAYSNNRMGIITRLGSSTEGQNQDAFFFEWDGSETEANYGTPIGSDAAVGINAYGSTWVILTRTGQFRLYNGGGWRDLATLPFYSLNGIWGDFLNKQGYGDIMQVDGDVIYINLGLELSSFGANGEESIAQAPSGVWCMDPKVGLYHRASPSISPVDVVWVDGVGIDPVTNIFTVTNGVPSETGNPVYLESSDTRPTPLEFGTIYYSIKLSASTFKLATTKQNALDGVAIDITEAGIGANFFLFLTLYDYGATFTTDRSGGVALSGSQSMVYDNLIFGGEYNDWESLSAFFGICITVPFLPNRGILVTAKINSALIQDNMTSTYIKFRPLKTDESIILKIQTRNVIGLPVTTQQNNILNNACTWVTERIFTTPSNISAAYDFINDDIREEDNEEIECMIISGAGAGQMAQIESITLESGVYTVTLEEDIDGAAEGRFCQVRIENWTPLGETITEADNEAGYKHFPITKESKWFKEKLEARGSPDLTIEEFSLISNVGTPGV